MKALFHTINDGQAHHRVILPSKFITKPLEEKGIDLFVASGFNSVDDYDAYIIQRLPSPNFMPYLEEIKRKGKKFIWSTDDDLWHIPKNNPAYKVYDEEAMKRIEWCRYNADWIISSTDFLTSKMKYCLGDEILVGKNNVLTLPNLLDLDQWKFERQPHEKLRVVFAGSAYHNDDLNMIAPACEEIVEKFDVQIIFFGDAPDSMIYWKRIHGDVLAEMMPHERYKGRVGIVRPVHIQNYPQVLCQLAPDIGICPLTKEEFNSSKSNLKYLEYTMAGACTVAQDCPPYDKCKCVLVKHAGDWKRYLTPLIRDYNPKDSNVIGWHKRAKEDVVNNFSWQNQKQLWIDGFIKMLS